MADQPLVTVITVTYNSSKYVRKAIESILASSYTNFELLISDDASSDNTWEIIQEYKDERIVACRNTTNIGEYNNRNKCIKLAKGEFIFFIDGDDMLFFRGIEDAIREMLRYPECQFGVVNTQSLKCVGPIKISSEDAFNLEFFGGGVVDGSLTNNV
ncbi:MAG: glycosyltransferase family 2 protein, partial [Flammeovirgaceae bacterium]